VCSGNPLLCVDGNVCTTDSCDVVLGCQFLSLPDSDADGLCDAEDNCPFIANPGWLDGGGLAGPLPDGIGDACQCGEVTGDGILDGSDVLAMQQNLIGVASLGAHAPRCNVVGPPDGGISDCGLADITALVRAKVPLASLLAQVCQPALP
jgi:hypothetical protein